MTNTLILIASLLLTPLAALHAAEAKRNVLFILADDLSWADPMLYVGDWKFTLDLADQPATLYDLKHDLTDRHNLVTEPAHAARVQAMEKTYRKLRASKRRTVAQ